ncbi:MAG TPA: spore germination protein GerW family protein [Candidatus Limnocylindrales bacterium]|jgi:uncharacterized spore protein YtfJ|nr:spore germination protein GerW family protein [Candidatus Limnocylindrales bacterium]
MTTTVDAAMDQARDAAAQPMDKVLDRLGERVGAQANVKAVFGEPMERGDVTVIPVARVRWGFGGGSGTGPADKGAVDRPDAASGTGAGAGVMADPMGYLEVRSSGAAFVPLATPYFNPLLILASGVAISFVLRALARLIRG